MRSTCLSVRVQGVYLAKRLSPRAPITPVSAVGLAIQLFGFLNVMWSDNRLITLRKPGETGGPGTLLVSYRGTCIVFVLPMLWTISMAMACPPSNLPMYSGYKIPTGGLFTFVSAANYCSEIIEWSGYALAAQGALAPLAFAVFVFCNLAPRGWQHHQWVMQGLNGCMCVAFLACNHVCCTH
jgi:3-oxo-5-alpha-steroid 4-dehydrogenase 1